MMNRKLVEQIIAAKCGGYHLGALAEDYYSSHSENKIQHIVEESVLLASIVDRELERRTIEEEREEEECCSWERKSLNQKS